MIKLDQIPARDEPFAADPERLGGRRVKDILQGETLACASADGTRQAVLLITNEPGNDLRGVQIDFTGAEEGRAHGTLLGSYDEATGEVLLGYLVPDHRLVVAVVDASSGEADLTTGLLPPLIQFTGE